jgi:hypothetical protein
MSQKKQSGTPGEHLFPLSKVRPGEITFTPGDNFAAGHTTLA